MLWALIGALAVILTATQFLPQVFKAYKTKRLEDISTLTYAMIIITSTTWIAYGLHNVDYAIITANVLVSFCAIATLILKIKYKEKEPV